MSRILAIDYGSKRVGIAVTDPMQIVANGLTTIHSKDVMNYLAEYMEKETVDTIVIGYPTNLDGTETDATPLVKGFVRKIRKAFPAQTIETWNEQFTSKSAKNAMIEGGLRKKQRQDKALVDKISATLILQSYLGI